MLRWLPSTLGVALLAQGCAFIDDFDYEFVADASVEEDGGAADGGGGRDGGEADGGPDGGSLDGGSLDGGATDGGSGRTCTPPCLGDAVLDFSADTQSAGPLAWEYLSDDRDPTGFGYARLGPDLVDSAPAWTDGTSAPAIIACEGRSEGDCAEADGGLAFRSDAAGGEGRDPVLAFTAPRDGTYVFDATAFSLAGAPEVIVSRNGRQDSVLRALVDAAVPTRVTATLELFSGERALFTVRPSASEGVRLAAEARVLESEEEPLAGCQLALRFEDPSPLAIGCASSAASLSELRGTETGRATGPDGSAARDFPEGSALELGGRFDYAGDFTVQLWVRIPRLGERQVLYTDWSAADPERIGGVRLWYDTRRPDGSSERSVTAGVLFPRPETEPSGPGFVDCNATRCQVEVAGDLPSLGEWHFLRLTRVSAEDEFRLCVDGELIGRGVLPGDVDISNPTDPLLGAANTFDTPSFEGQLDDVRIFDRALPCGD
ncbi:MAG TPA: LamG domain-containing protein [Polyangiaceae bacterium LLY-WYZ-15_(1-7)]|nr:hypothetical protein [Sandaracinus sp.]HJK95323.1 LamG domain-containing protein [Polyangiaceae bacterium LLY-WYZ-15_(1-7)]HJL01670.1 LamG domain-containing protein [Polyangiaceae bacterium LLY-WYZ-15_(1-7)]HJL08710.1 LamG domain-containing protein [Polyangiaceae bacterium LLY-WYZ-15_(1-7)]HJL23322.1 LamG domain-containing protein [Polyangiaceae bacterium LLY-WYZ-15_(1-7)]